MVFESAASRELERSHEQKDHIEECVGAGLQADNLTSMSQAPTNTEEERSSVV